MKHQNSAISTSPLAALGLLLALVPAFGCGGSDDAAGANATQAEPTVVAQAEPVDGPTLTALSSREAFRVEITPKGGPIPTNEPFSVRLAVKGASTGAPYTGFDDISLDARMPAHDHGMLRDVELTKTDTPGEYLAEGLLFHMIGRWEFHVDVTRGPLIERAQVSTTLEF